MARFAIGDRVITPRHGEGEVVMVYPKGKHGSTVYGISTNGQRTCLMVEERDLTAAPHIPAGATVRCADCAHGYKSHYLLNAVRCRIFARAKSAQSLRLCAEFKRRAGPQRAVSLNTPEI